MCKNLEDTLRYFDCMNEEVDICRVIGYGKIDYYEDLNNEFYEMYATEYMIIKEILSREETLSYIIKLPSYRILRFILLYKLNENEIKKFKELFYKDESIIDYIKYYQEKDTKVFERKLLKK